MTQPYETVQKWLCFFNSLIKAYFDQTQQLVGLRKGSEGILPILLRKMAGPGWDLQVLKKFPIAH